MQRLNQSKAGVRTVSTFQQVALAALWFIIAMMIAATPSRGEPVSLNAKIANSRLVGQVSAALSTYASRVDSLVQDDERASWAWADVAAAGAYRRLAWYVSVLQVSATASETAEFSEIQQMIDVYRELHERIAASAKAGNHSATARTARTAAAVVEQIHAALQRVETRGNNDLHAVASRMAALN